MNIPTTHSSDHLREISRRCESFPRRTDLAVRDALQRIRPRRYDGALGNRSTNNCAAVETRKTRHRAIKSTNISRIPTSGTRGAHRAPYRTVLPPHSTHRARHCADIRSVSTGLTSSARRVARRGVRAINTTIQALLFTYKA